MNRTKNLTCLWFSGGIICSILVFLTLWSGLSGNIFVSDPECIPDSVDTVMRCIQSGNWEDLEEIVLGTSSLVPNTGEEGSPEQILYHAYQESLQWRCQGEFQIQDGYITQNITVSCLDIPKLGSAAAAFLAESSIFLDNSEDLSQQLRSFTEKIVAEYAPITEHTLTLVFLMENGNWQLVPNAALQSLISGFTVI